ncbi:hypothetical protein HCB46_04445 [Listeria ivanovii]|uniref:DUF3592 domain-containing protein n=1 Tax=Listeria ivanovii TaxID=1638 RepID=UPI00162752E7|nr:DUF3592 domain-containing protein [Listeria ivanovii]MBC2254717.1 hypothetical protein [Listeria ivanovii]
MIITLLIIVGIVIVIIISLYFIIATAVKKASNTNWEETNALVVASRFTSRTMGDEISRAQGETVRRVELTVRFKLRDGSEFEGKRWVTIKTKHSSWLYENKVVTIMYDTSNPKRFKIKE